MRVFQRRSGRAAPPASASASAGTAKVGRRTKDLIARLQPGDIAVIDHEDLDRIAAEGLIRAGVGGIVNAAASISGRYPNVGPLLVAAAGIPLVDNVGSEALDSISDGDRLELDGGQVTAGGAVVAQGERQDLESLEAAYEHARTHLDDELSRFAENTLEYLRRERHLVLDPPDLPPLRTAIKGRHTLVVVRGADYLEDLAHLRPYVVEVRPVLIAVDGGADALLEAGHKPDIILGDFDSVSSNALRCGAELIVHAYPDGRAPGAARLDELGLSYTTIRSAGTSEDVALLTAYELGAELIVAVGTHASMVEFLEKGRAGMASTFLVRLKVGPILVDAKGVSRLYATRVRKRDLFLIVLAGLLCFVVLSLVVVPRVFIDGVWLILRDFWHQIAG